jgi:hypothetical protein
MKYSFVCLLQFNDLVLLNADQPPDKLSLILYID